MPGDLATKREVKMTTLRVLVLMLLVVMLTVLPIATATAEASGLDQAYWFAQYLCEDYLWCD